MNEKNFFKKKMPKIKIVKSSDNLFINNKNKLKIHLNKSNNNNKQYFPNINNIHIKNNFIKLNKLKKYNSEIYQQINNISQINNDKSNLQSCIINDFNDNNNNINNELISNISNIDVNNKSIEILPKILTKNNSNSSFSPSRKKTDLDIFIQKKLHEKPKLKYQIILDKIYGFNNNNYLKNINKYKKEGEKIAFNKKFDILKYQSKGLELVSENFCLKNIKLLSEKYRVLNNQIYNKFKVKKTKWERLADSLEKRAPKGFLEKLRNLGKKNVNINIDGN